MDGIVLDITADQFEDQKEPVIVMRDSPWHAQFSKAPVKADAASVAFAPTSGVSLDAILATLFAQ